MYKSSFICIHAPTEVADDGGKILFYHQLERTYSAYDINAVLGDFKDKLGEEQHFIGRIIKHSIDEATNDKNNTFRCIYQKLN